MDDQDYGHIRLVCVHRCLPHDLRRRALDDDRDTGPRGLIAAEQPGTAGDSLGYLCLLHLPPLILHPLAENRGGPAKLIKPP